MKQLLYSLFIILALTACSGGKEPTGGGSNNGGGNNTGGGGQTPPSQPQITLESYSVDFTSEGGSSVIAFTSSDAWTAEVINSRADGWCTIEPTSGTAGNAKITVTTTANDTPDDRTASVVIKSGSASRTVQVSQKQKDAITATSSRFEVGYEGGEVVIEVNANVAFGFEIDSSAQEWIWYHGTRAVETSTLVFYVATNDNGEKREGHITLTGGDINEVITIYQFGTDPVIVLSQNEYYISQEGETIAVEVTSNLDVSVEIPEGVTWITENTTRGISTNTYYFDIAENGTYDTRSAEISFTNQDGNITEKVKIVQQPIEIINITSSTELSLGKEGGEITIDVESNIDLDIEVSNSWIKQVDTATRALTTDKFTFTIAENVNPTKREGSIVFKSKYSDLSQTVKIYQEKGNTNIESPEDGGDYEWQN